MKIQIAHEKSYSRFRRRVALVAVAVGCGCLAIWVGRSERQRKAVASLRALEICEVHYDFDPAGSHPNAVRALNPTAVPDPPGWAAKLIGTDYFHKAVKVFVATEHVERSLPHLKRLPCLLEVYVFDNNDHDTSDERLDSSVKRLRNELPEVKVSAYHSHGLHISTSLVVG